LTLFGGERRTKKAQASADQSLRTRTSYLTADTTKHLPPVEALILIRLLR
jgi:hypothetical protein